MTMKSALKPMMNRIRSIKNCCSSLLFSTEPWVLFHFTSTKKTLLDHILRQDFSVENNSYYIGYPGGLCDSKLRQGLPCE